MELTDLTIKEVHQGLVKKKFSALEICQAYLEKIEKEDKKIKAFLTITKTVEDAKIVFEAIRGRDELDSTSVNSKFKIYG